MRLSCLLSALLVVASTPHGSLAADTDAPYLRVKPVLCIANRQSDICATVFQIYWKSSRTGDYCLASNNQGAPLRCWTQANGGEHRDNVIVTQDFYYWLSEPASTRKLSPVKVELLRIHGDDRRRERRSRHVWDVL
jgi:hypothetical protein